MSLDLHNVIKHMEEWAREAGRIQMHWFNNPKLSIQSKSTDVDLVTVADQQSEKLILEYIQSLYPEHAVLSEEAGKNEMVSDWRWVIDPLDGTTNFAQGIPVFAVSIALQYKEESVAGVVYNPVTEQLFSAVKGHGAYLNGHPITVGEKADLQHCVLASGFPYDRAKTKDNNSAHFAAMVPKVRGLRRLGAAAYDLANVAAGVMDGYWEMSLGLWDIAAGTLIVQEAGGHVEMWREDREIAIIAGNQTIVKNIRRILEEVQI